LAAAQNLGMANVPVRMQNNLNDLDWSRFSTQPVPHTPDMLERYKQLFPGFQTGGPVKEDIPALDNPPAPPSPGPLPGQPGGEQLGVPGTPDGPPIGYPGGPAVNAMPSTATSVPSPLEGVNPDVRPQSEQRGRYPGEGLNVPKGEGIKPGGGLIGGAESAAASMGGMFPGGGAAAAGAQIGIDEINRAIQFGGQLIGIGVNGLMETFLPNESPLADIGGSWLGRIGGAIAGVSAAAPNLAGLFGSGKPAQGRESGHGPAPGEPPPPGPGDNPGPLTPEQVNPPPPVNGPQQTNNINVAAVAKDPNDLASTTADLLSAGWTGPGGINGP
jgi:hypothetical protein